VNSSCFVTLKVLLDQEIWNMDCGFLLIDGQMTIRSECPYVVWWGTGGGGRLSGADRWAVRFVDPA